MAKHQRPQPPLDAVQVGDVTFYNARVVTLDRREFVTFYVGSEAVMRDEGGIIENGGQEVMLDKRSWDSMVAALQASHERKAA